MDRAGRVVVNVEPVPMEPWSGGGDDPVGGVPGVDGGGVRPGDRVDLDLGLWSDVREADFDLTRTVRVAVDDVDADLPGLLIERRGDVQEADTGVVAGAEGVAAPGRAKRDIATRPGDTARTGSRSTGAAGRPVS